MRSKKKLVSALWRIWIIFLSNRRNHFCQFNHTFHISDEAFSDRTFLNLQNSRMPGILERKSEVKLQTAHERIQLNFIKPISLFWQQNPVNLATSNIPKHMKSFWNKQVNLKILKHKTWITGWVLPLTPFHHNVSKCYPTKMVTG